MRIKTDNFHRQNAEFFEIPVRNRNFAKKGKKFSTAFRKLLYHSIEQTAENSRKNLGRRQSDGRLRPFIILLLSSSGDTEPSSVCTR